MKKAAFSRNPWDRAVAAFFFLKQGGMNAADKAWSDVNLTRFERFSDFVENWIPDQGDLVGAYWHFVPQSFFVSLPGNPGIAVDFVGRVESLQKDYDVLLKEFGLRPERPLARSNESVRRRDYRSYYSDRAAEIVGEAYADDVRHFGYSFG